MVPLVRIADGGSAGLARPRSPGLASNARRPVQAVNVSVATPSVSVTFHNDFSTLVHPVSVTLDASHQRGEAYPMIVRTEINLRASAPPGGGAGRRADTRMSVASLRPTAALGILGFVYRTYLEKPGGGTC